MICGGIAVWLWLPPFLLLLLLIVLNELFKRHVKQYYSHCTGSHFLAIILYPPLLLYYSQQPTSLNNTGSY